MSHLSLRKLIEDNIHAIHDDVQYTYGTETDFNVQQVTKMFLVHTDPLVASSTYADNQVNNYVKAWSVSMVFAMIDEHSNLGYAVILDKTDNLVDRFINRFNLADGLLLSGIGQEPFIKGYANSLSGYILTFTATLNDDFDYCDDC